MGDNKTPHIKVTCDACGDQNIPFFQALVMICENDRSAALTYRCPGCGIQQIKTPVVAVIKHLIECGVPARFWRLPTPNPHLDAPQFVWDDLLDFHLAISGITELGDIKWDHAA